MHPLKRLRKLRGWKISELAELTGLNTGTISTIENGTSAWKTHQGVAILLADALDCEVHDIFEPDELSHKGRPPLTGGHIRITTVVELAICPVHCIALPANGVCDYCS